jgi:hypothetical protein
MLEMDGSFDETELGFPKFSKFLGQAEEHGVVVLTRNEAGNFEVGLGGGDGETRSRGRGRGRAHHEPSRDEVHEASAGDETVAWQAPETVSRPEPEEVSRPEPETVSRPEPEEEISSEPTVVEFSPGELEDQGLRLGPRRGSTRRRDDDDGPILLPGQGVPSGHTEVGDDAMRPVPSAGDPLPQTSGGNGAFDPSELGLPTDPEAIVRYLTHRYRGVGEKTAELLVERFGAGLFGVLRDDPGAISDAVTAKRAEQVLEAWQIDYERRRTRRSGGAAISDEGRPSERGSRRGGSRRRGSRGRSES